MDITKACAGSASSKGKRNKQRLEDFDKNFTEMLDSFCGQVDSHMDKIVNHIGAEQDLSNARKEVYEVLSKLPTLSRWDRLIVTTRFVKNHENMDMFFTLPSEDREEWVKLILDGVI